MDITPHVNLLKSLRGERVNHLLLIGEGVDNALDADAKTVHVTYERDHMIEFRDDGKGILAKNINALFSLGTHRQHSTTALGRFGVGITSQAVSTGDILEIASTSADGRFRASANWRSILESGVWSIDDPRWIVPLPIGATTGTAVRITKLRSASRYSSTEKIIEDLAMCFYPALADGRKIIFNGQEVSLKAEPNLQHETIVDQQLILSGGRSAHLRAGMLAAPSTLNHVHVGFLHRVIMPAVRLGCGSYGGASKMYARVQLSGPWHLAKFKDEITDEDEREELEDAVAEALQPILEKCNSASMSARLESLTSKINELVPPKMRPSRPHRKKPEPNPIIWPRQKKKRDSGEVDPDKSDESINGPARSRRRPEDQLIISWDASDAVDGVGKLVIGKPYCVNLSPDNPYIAAVRDQKDQDMAARTLVATAFMIYLRERGGNAPELPFDEFGRQLSYLLSIQNVQAQAAE